MLEIPELKPHFVELLGVTPIVSWGAKKLIELARMGELEARQFQKINGGPVHESISDTDLFEILSALNDLKEGVFSTIEILNMRFFTDRESDYISNEKLRSVGRQAILKMLSMDMNEINRNRQHGIDPVVEECLSNTAPENEIVEIVGLLCDGIESCRLYSSGLEKIVDTLVKNFPEIVLNRVLANNENEQVFAHLLFKDRFNCRGSSLNLVAVDRVVKWCDGNQNRIKNAASAVSSYSSMDEETPLIDNPKQVILSSHIKSLLDIAENKIEIVETIFLRTWPSQFSGSLAEILEVRAKAFSELLDHHSPEVRELAKTKLSLIEESIHKNREREAEQYTRREQRFE